MTAGSKQQIESKGTMSRIGSKYLGETIKRRLFWYAGDCFKENHHGIFEKIQILEMGRTWRMKAVQREVAVAYANEWGLQFIEGLPAMELIASKQGKWA